MGVKACYISGEQDDQLVKEGVRKGDYQVVYFTPEMILASKRWREMLVGQVYTNRLRTFVIDEAHTVKKWYTTMYFIKHSYINNNNYLGGRLSGSFCYELVKSVACCHRMSTSWH